uniref:hypothetical protein n=1 Tax=Hoeflea sp. TaxID=1940281 RepID=UPI002AFDF362
GKELRAMLNSDDKAAISEIFHLQEIIPGILPEIENGIVTVYDHPRAAALTKLSQNKRLGSPEHTRFYFAFSNPRLGMSPGEVRQIVELAANDLPSLQNHLIDLANKKRPINSTWFEYLIDRLLRETQSDWSEVALSNFAIALANVMDEVMRSPSLRDAWGRPQVDAPASELAYRLLNKLRDRNPGKRDQTLRKMVENGEAFVWLLDEFVTQELRRQGYFKWTPEPKHTWNLNKEEAEFAREAILSRLQTSIDRERLFESNRLASPLFRWQELCDGDASPASKWLDEHTRTDEAFLHAIAGLGSRVNSSERGIYDALPKRNVEPFTEWSAVVSRLESIAQDAAVGPDLQARASRLLENLNEDI